MILRRPFAFFGGVVLLSCFLFFQLESRLFAVITLFVSLASGICFLFFGRDRIRLFVVGIALLFIGLSSVSFLLTDVFLIAPAEKEIGVDKDISAIIYDYPIKSGDRFYIDAKIKPDSSPFYVNCRLSFSKENYYLFLEDAGPGDEVSFKGTVYKLGGGTVEYEDNYRSLCKVIGAYPTGFVEVREHVKKVPFSFFKDLRKNIKQYFIDNYDEERAGIAVASLLGDKSLLDRSIYDSMKKAGIAHIFAVSGLHLSIWILFFDRILHFLGFDKKRYNYLLIMLVFSAMLLAGMSPSVCRAGVTLILMLLFDSISRKGDSLNSLGIATVLILLVRPSLSINVGFLLSLSATIGILGFSVPVCSKLKNRLNFVHEKRNKFIISAASVPVVSFGAWFFSLPVSVLSFGEVSLFSVLTNVLAYIFEAPMIVCFGLTGLSRSSSFLVKPIDAVSSFCSSAVVRTADRISSITFAWFRVDGFSKIAFVALLCGIVVCASVSYKFRSEKITLLSLSIFLVLLVFFNLTLIFPLSV